MRKKITLLLIMGLFSKLFGQTENNSSDSKVEKELKLEFNVMKNITLEKCKKYENTGQYELVENGIYRDLKDEDDAKYRMTISYELESNETNGQYPLEDILDKYLMFVNDFLESENLPNTNKYKIELGGYLDEMKTAKEIIGKKVFNREFKAEDGQIMIELIIE